MSYTFEQVTAEHSTAVVDIYNHYVATSFATSRTSPVGEEFFQAFLQLTSGYPFLASRYEDKEVVGFACLHPFRSQKAFSKTAEISYFILPDHTRKGLASRILKQLVSDARERGITVILADISSLNEGSIRFHEKHGFWECGRLRNIGRKFEKDFDVVWMRLDLNSD